MSSLNNSDVTQSKKYKKWNKKRLEKIIEIYDFLKNHKKLPKDVVINGYRIENFGMYFCVNLPSTNDVQLWISIIWTGSAAKFSENSTENLSELNFKPIFVLHKGRPERLDDAISIARNGISRIDLRTKEGMIHEIQTLAILARENRLISMP